MADLETALSGILSDPEAMSKIMDLGKSLGLTESGSSETEKVTPKNEQTTPASSFDSLSSLTSLLKGNSSADNHSGAFETTAVMSKLATFLPLINKMNSEDETTALLNALRPFLSEQKRRRLDDAGKMLRVMKILPFLSSTGLF